MQLAADHVFVQGSTHQVCQDYSYTSTEHSPAVAIVADGCSSSPHTDVGARLLALEAGLVSARGVDMIDVGTACAMYGSARAHVPWAIRDVDCLDATLLVAQAFPATGILRVVAWGDGVLVRRRRADAGLEVVRVSFLGPNDKPSDYPVYLAYFTREDRLHTVLERSPFRRVETWDLAAGQPPQVSVESVRDNPVFVWSGEAEQYDLITLLSDGVGTFYREVESGTWKHPERIGLSEVIEPLVSFRGAGPFVLRRVTRALRDWAREGITHADDLAVAALRIGGEA